MTRRPIVFSTLSYAPLADRIAGHAELDLGAIERRFFPDGERYLRIAIPVEGRDVALVGGTGSDQDVLELYDLASALVENGSRSLSIVAPYFGCSTMERAKCAGESVTAKNRARLLSSLPVAPDGHRILLVDLHTEGIPHYFEGALRAVHVTARDLVTDAIRSLGGDDFVLACTDAGRAKWVDALSIRLGVDAAFVFKRRLTGERTSVSAVSAQVQDRHVVIYDDMIRTGSSLIGAANAYRSAGAARLSAVATHGVLPGEALANLRRTGLFERIVVTDSHPAAVPSSDGFLQVVSVAPLLAEQLKAGMF